MAVWLQRTLLVLLGLASLLFFTVYFFLEKSLPQLEGQIHTTSLSAPVQIERDALGIPTIKGENRIDVAFATGYLHAQDRFFQMDLNRRSSAGELSELFGEVTLKHDKLRRKHRFRRIAHQVFLNLSLDDQALLKAYTAGVNKGLKELSLKPFEYWLLQIEPKFWQVEDSFLTLFSMYLDLNDSNANLDQTKDILSRLVPLKVIDFMSPLHTRWDAPLMSGSHHITPVPSSEEINLRDKPAEFYRGNNETLIDQPVLGSNNWAVSGNLTEHGSAIIENDMHLGLRVPTVWYRAQLQYPHPHQASKKVTVTGVTLPGAPLVVVGSNGDIAWGFTNSYGDWVDLVELHIGDDDYYTTPEGPEKLTNWTETIQVKNQQPVEVTYQSTRWGPIVESMYDDSQYALRWTAHDAEASNLNLELLETSETVYDAIEVANSSGIPPQNFTVGDSKGNIAWTIAGRIPTRNGSDSTYPLPWQYADSHWQMWLPIRGYPKVINPLNDRIWTANSRVASGMDYAKLGNGGYALGPRQKQIKDQLMDLESANEQQLLDIALDDRALYMESWRQLALGVLSGEQSAERNEFKTLILNWSGKASVEDAGYRLVREFHDQVSQKILSSLGMYFSSLASQPMKEINALWLQNLNHEEAMILRLLEEQPLHWLSSNYSSWDELMLQSIDEVISELGGADKLKKAAWGDRNLSAIDHPLSRAIPFLGRWLNMPEVPLSGDLWMPKVQKPAAGASQRMVVSPGREEQGIFHMPGGQSGHPMSPFYSKGYKDWEEEGASAFLPGKTEFTLTLKP